MPIGFDVLYYAKSRSPDAIQDEIGKAEGEYIRRYLPPLNTQIPNAQNYGGFVCMEIDENEFLRWLDEKRTGKSCPLSTKD